MAKVDVDVRYDITPPDQWPADRKTTLAVQLISDVDRSLTSNVERALEFIDLAQRYQIWKFLNCGSLDEMLATRDLTPEAIEQYRRGVALLRHRGHQGPISKEQATKAAVEEARANPASSHGGDRKSGNQVRNPKLKSGSETIQYTLARLARDGHDELLDAVASGEISVNAAAIQVGYRKKYTASEKCVREFRKAENRLEPLRVIVAELDEYERNILKDWLEA